MAAMELKQGDCVHYGSHGVCRVCGMEERCVGGRNRMYYTLRPTGGENILLYLPVDAEPEKIRLRRLMSREEIMKLIDRSCAEQVHWISDSKVRREAFSKILRGGDAGELISMLKTIHQHQKELPQGKPLPMTDQEMMNAARRQLHSEMAYVLGLEEQDVLPFILERVAEST